MKRHFTAILILMFLTVILSCGVEDETDSDNENGSDTDNGEKTDDPEEIVVFPDHGLEKCVRSVIQKPEGEITVEDVKNVNTLLCDEMGILRIDGIEKIINLNYLSLTRNNIKDFSLLKNLKSLKTLDIIGNINTNVETLGELSSLEELEAGNCGLTELGAIINLVELKKLSISPNNIKSIEEVKNLTGLKFLSVPTNYLKNDDLPVLLNLVNLEHLNVEENCLTDFTITNELREKGVEVVVGQQDTTRCK